MILAYERLGMYREAIAVGREVTRFDPSPFLQTFLIYALARSGERLAAETLLDELIETTEARYVCQQCAFRAEFRKGEIQRRPVDVGDKVNSRR